MKVSIKTLRGSSFEIEVDPSSKVADVKKLIESTQGQNVYPTDQQMLIHQGNFLKNEMTLEENKVLENNFIVIMLSKKGSSSAALATAKAPMTSVDRVICASPAIQPPPEVPAPVAPASAPAPTATAAPSPISAAFTEADPFGQAASNLVAGGNLEATIQSILEMGGGAWDRGTIVRALQVAYNSPERSVQSPGPNANPLDLFPRVSSSPSILSPIYLQSLPNAGGGNRNVLRNNTQFRGLLSLVQANSQILQPLLQLGKQNPQIMQLIQENRAEFWCLINEQPLEGAVRSLLDQFAISLKEVTTEENEAIQRLARLMGFERDFVLEVFFACNKDEEMAADHLFEYIKDFGSGW